MLDGRIIARTSTTGSTNRHEGEKEKLHLAETRVAFVRPLTLRPTRQCRLEAATRQSPQKEEFEMRDTRCAIWDFRFLIAIADFQKTDN